MLKNLLALLAAYGVFAASKSCTAAEVVVSGETLNLSEPIDVTSASLGQTVLGTLFWNYENGSSTPRPQNDLAPSADRQPEDFVGNQRNNLPSYLRVGAGEDLEGVSGGWNYQRVLDDFGPSFESGSLAAASIGSEMLTLIIESDAPAAMRIGILQDNLDDVGFVQSVLAVEIGGMSASVNPMANRNRLGDVYWFDLTELAAGDVLSIHSGGSGRFGLVGGVIVADIPMHSIADINKDGEVSIADVDMLAQALRDGSNSTLFDVNADGDVTFSDIEFWVNQLTNTYFGDANLDGEFNSGDLVNVFQAGKFESGLDASWSEGDWNADALFDSSDFVSAFQDGGFEQGPRIVAKAVPEPKSLTLLALGLIATVVHRRRNIIRKMTS